MMSIFFHALDQSNIEQYLTIYSLYVFQDESPEKEPLIIFLGFEKKSEKYVYNTIFDVEIASYMH